MRIAEKHGWRHTAKLLKLQLDPLTVYAFDYLEAQGWRFCVHFGTKNAVERAQDEWLKTMERK